MEKNRYYSLALESLAELASEIEAAKSASSPAVPNIDSVLEGFGSLPPGALLLGIAEDGLPVLLDLYDAVPGPLMIIGDSQAGKTALAKFLASAAIRSFDPQNLQFGVLTSNPGEWQELEQMPHAVGILSSKDDSAMEFVASLYDWTHQNKSEQTVILFLDGMECVNQWNETARNQLRWLLMRGPARRVWPILTLNSTAVDEVQHLMGFFRTFIYGHVQDRSLAEALTNSDDSNLDQLNRGIQFTMREGRAWLRFWIPRV